MSQPPQPTPPTPPTPAQEPPAPAEDNPSPAQDRPAPDQEGPEQAQGRPKPAADQEGPEQAQGRSKPAADQEGPEQAQGRSKPAAARSAQGEPAAAARSARGELAQNEPAHHTPAQEPPAQEPPAPTPHARYQPTRHPVPWRTIWATIFSVAVTLAAFFVVEHVTRILTWLFVALFFAIILCPAVDFLCRRARLPRAMATLLVFLVLFAAIGGMVYAFVRPLIDQSEEVADKFPTFVADAKAGRGPIGPIVRRYNLDQRLEDNKDRLQKNINKLGSNSLTIVKGVGNAVAAGLTIFVLSFLMILEGPKMLAGGLSALSPERRERTTRVAADCAKAVTGYMAGNLLISAIAGIATFAFLFIADVPFRGVLGLWVAFADLIPLVGATLGAVPTVIVAFLHSVPAGIATIVFYVLYQQFENHVLQVTIMARTVDLNPLVVLVSVLLGVELFGLLGALLAIPVAGVIQVIARDIWDEHTGRLKDEPTVGASETPINAASEGA
jgi:predicted PurR-regulated permease PerM